jgi:hypothetical protein
MDFSKYLQSAKNSLFRFEYLQEFDMPEEHELFKTYKATGKVEIRPILQDWWNFLEMKHTEGVCTQRVRLIRSPMTKYLEWELYGHRQTIKHGDDIRVLDENRLMPELEDLGDFWVIDDSIALKMNYDSTGKYLGFKEVDPKLYIKAKKYLLDNSVELL